MKWKLTLIIGVVLLPAGIVGFLMASVGLATADKMPRGIRAPEGVELRLPPDDVSVRRQRRQAETVLLGSGLVGGCGIILTGAGWWMRRKSARNEP